MTQPPTPPPYGAPDPQSGPPQYQPPQAPPPYSGPPAVPPGGQPGGQQGYAQPPAGPFYLNQMGQEHGPFDLNQLAQMAAAGQLKGDAPVRPAESQQYIQAKQIPGLFSDKEWLTTALLSWLTGSFGVDRFYLGYTGLGVAKLCTLGGCGIWHIIDLVLVLTRKLPDAQGRPLA